jgi:hypothetical protein
MLHRRLASEKESLEYGKITLNGIIERIVINEFEYKTKRQFDLYDKQVLHERYFCANLQDNEEKMFFESDIIVMQ